MDTERMDGEDAQGGTLREDVFSSAASHTFTPRRLVGESDMDNIAQDVLELLERMRVDLSQLKGSIDLKENTERIISIRAAQYFRASKQTYDRQLKQIEKSASPHRLPHAGFFFVPMATAPVTSLRVCNTEKKTGQPQGQQQQQSRCHYVVTKSMPDFPPWNASTSLQKSEKMREKKKPSASDLDRETALAPANLSLSPRIVLSVHNTVSAGSTGGGPTFSKEDGVDSNSNKITQFSRENEVWVRDYLRRLNIVGCELAESDERIDDPVLNGVALRRLVDLALDKNYGKKSTLNPVILLEPRNIDDVRKNYVVALSALRRAESALSLSIPKQCRLIRPESVIVRGDSAALFLLMRTIADACLPTTCEQLWSAPSITWQPDPTGGSYASSEMRSLERAVCSFLCFQGVLADPITHQLLPDDAPVPTALCAPFLPPKRGEWCIRKVEFPSLYVPSVFPFITNGTALCDVVEKITGSRICVHRNPRVKSKCIENIEAAFMALQTYCPIRMSSLFITAPDRVFYGDRRYILLLMEDIMRLADGAPPRRNLPCLKGTPYIGSRRLSRTSNSVPNLSPQQPCLVSVSEFPHPDNLSARRSIMRNGIEEKPVSLGKVTPRCHLTSPLSVREEEGQLVVTERVSTTSVTQVEAKIKTCVLNPSAEVLSKLRYTRDEVEAMRKWLIAVLGAEFQYTAADNSFCVSCRDLYLSERSFFFSDGVLFAHLIRTLERRRCVELESIEVHAKATAAKRRNINKCILFLQTEKRILLNMPLLDHILLSGGVNGVLYVMHSLKNTYRFAVRT